MPFRADTWVKWCNSMGLPFVSVVIPTYNRDDSLEAAARSVLAQTYPHFELIIVDDGSTDRTAEIVQTLVRQHRDRGPRIRYIFQSNTGQSAARNSGSAVAQGEWIGFLDADDLWLPNKLEWQIQAIEQCGQECGACFTDARLVDSRGLDVTAFAKADMSYRGDVGRLPEATRRLAGGFGGIWVQTLMARRDLVEQLGGFDTDLQFAEDHDFLFRLSLITAFAYVNRPLAVIDRTSRAFDPTARPRRWDTIDVRLHAEQRRLEKWLNATHAYPPDVKKKLLDNLAGVHSTWANWHLERDEFRQARHASETAVRYHCTARSASKWALIHLMPQVAKRMVPPSVRRL